MYMQNVPAAGAGVAGLEATGSHTEVGFDASRLHALQDRLARGHAQRVPFEETVTAALEFLLTGNDAGFEEGARRAAARGNVASSYFNAQSRAIPELVNGMVDRGMPVRYVLGLLPEKVPLFANSWTRGWDDLAISRRALCPPTLPSEGASGQRRLREAVDLLRPGEATVVFPSSGDALMVARDRDGLLVMGRDERGAQGQRPALYRGAHAEQRLQRALALAGGRVWGMVQMAASP